MTWWQQLLSQLASNAVIMAAVGWLLNNAISTALSRSNDKFRQQLAQTAQLEVDKTRLAIESAAAVQKVRFESLHNKRAELIADLYAYVADTVAAAASLVSMIEYTPGPSKVDRLNAFGEAYNKLRTTFDRNRLYFSNEVCEKAEALLAMLREHVIRFKVFVVEGEARKHLDAEARKVWEESWKAISEDKVPPLRRQLEIEFKAILGVEP